MCDAATLAKLEEAREDYQRVRQALHAVLAGAQSYTLDTSQTRQTVTKASVDSLRLMLEFLKTDIDDLEARCRRGGRTTRVIPGF